MLWDQVLPDLGGVSVNTVPACDAPPPLVVPKSAPVSSSSKRPNGLLPSGPLNEKITLSLQDPPCWLGGATLYTAPTLLTPPSNVTPYRFPSSSVTRSLEGNAPSLPLTKLYKIVSTQGRDALAPGVN